MESQLTPQLGGLFAHVLLFWSKDIVRTVRHWREQHDEDPHHAAMRKYPEAPMWWYIAVMVFGLVTGLACCATQDIQLPWWAFIVALVLGCAISPFVSGSTVYWED